MSSKEQARRLLAIELQILFNQTMLPPQWRSDDGMAALVAARARLRRHDPQWARWRRLAAKALATKAAVAAA